MKQIGSYIAKGMDAMTLSQSFPTGGIGIFNEGNCGLTIVDQLTHEKIRQMVKKDESIIE